MFATRRTFTRSYAADSSAVGSARHDVADFALSHGLDGERLDGVRTAVSEAVANAVIHAYRGEPGEIHVTAAVADTDLWILVADEGYGVQTPTRTPGLGWGLALIANAAEEFVIAERGERGTEVRMRFTLADG